MDEVTLTNDEAKSLYGFLEYYLKFELENYNDQTDENGIEFLTDILSIRKKCKAVSEDG